ncbi:bifunctional diaminohydroxyphosphoribosylaminopyrimidine deaminase/5-amino-6-(5-phosphoribosylamino)uracil reductase RibD [Luteococcus sp. Sow4_B9]|uniref:bifunctional diaminohydroxyphosphoribosylaminopyrimidine deaminase/5-amino-6-(5-phosphoribosylamino)uracil reductase RibD n=1 Tax=Luteococcus sp. Sow4_B9 TaxID=3438792 RepID=UPI003F9CCF5C
MEEPPVEAVRDAMRHALALAARGIEADPNPRVGCVLLGPQGEVVAEGWHQGAGTPHAEALALAVAGHRANGCTAVVTLEPCNHSGRTGPCSEALVRAGIRRVVYAQDDPNPEASGGSAHLRASGIDVRRMASIDPDLASRSEALNRSWNHRVRTGLPLVTWKFAASLDGRSVAADGSSQWITGQAMRQAMHERRGLCGAVVVGTGTVLQDDPRLTARDARGAELARQPLRVVVGERPVPAEARVRGADGLFRQFSARDPRTVLRALAQEGIHHVWLEGGPTLAAAWWRAGVIDEVIACIAPALLGAGRPAVDDLGIGTMAEIARLSITDVERHGQDIALLLAVPGRGPVPADPAQAGAVPAGPAHADNGNSKEK